MNEYLFVILQAMWFMLPSMLAGPGATFCGGGSPMDFGKSMPDGNRVLGDGKTWRGLLGGVMFGAATGIVMELLVRYTAMGDEWSYGGGPSAWFLVLLLGFGSIFGDSLGSFLKRRVGIERGAKYPFMDQYDYVMGTLILWFIYDAFLFLAFSHDSFFVEHYLSGIAWVGLLVLVVQTPIVHRLVNLVGYWIGVKQVPW